MKCFAATNDDVSTFEFGPTGPDRFDLGSEQHQTSLKGLEDIKIKAGAFVAGVDAHMFGKYT